ncbi:60S ribosomal protein L31 [Candidatus Woesearchaeota archaeon]|nr:60S ribosomal protein L31 [Candidatus Woesearchaeota archaeon]
MATKKESKPTIERDYVIPLRKGLNQVVAHKKASRVIRDIKAFLLRHTKADEVKLGMHLNLEVWKHGMKNPPSKVKVHVKVADGVARAELFGKEFKEAVKAEKKEKGPETLKDKIEKKLGVDEKSLKKEEAKVEKAEAAKEKEEKKAESPKAEAKPAATPAKPSAKPATKKKAAPKKE